MREVEGLFRAAPAVSAHVVAEHLEFFKHLASKKRPVTTAGAAITTNNRMGVRTKGLSLPASVPAPANNHRSSGGYNDSNKNRSFEQTSTMRVNVTAKPTCAKPNSQWNSASKQLSTIQQQQQPVVDFRQDSLDRPFVRKTFGVVCGASLPRSAGGLRPVTTTTVQQAQQQTKQQTQKQQGQAQALRDPPNLSQHHPLTLHRKAVTARSSNEKKQQIRIAHKARQAEQLAQRQAQQQAHQKEKLMAMVASAAKASAKPGSAGAPSRPFRAVTKSNQDLVSFNVSISSAATAGAEDDIKSSSVLSVYDSKRPVSSPTAQQTTTETNTENNHSNNMRSSSSPSRTAKSTMIASPTATATTAAKEYV